jgi:regulator of sirC expression with transglutaminase-like and TPR domain
MDPAHRFAEHIASHGPGAGRPMPPLEELLALIGAAFDLPDATDPSGDAVVGRVRSELDDLADRCEPSFDSILHVLFASGRLRGNSIDYGDPRNSYLQHVLRRGVGIPITLSVCAMEVGRRLGVAVEGIGLPGHFVVRCGGVYADPFHGGRTIRADELELEWRRLTGLRSSLDARLLGPVHPRSLVVRVLNNLKNTFVALDDPAPLRVLATLRGAFPELHGERAEHARWLRFWN